MLKIREFIYLIWSRDQIQKIGFEEAGFGLFTYTLLFHFQLTGYYNDNNYNEMMTMATALPSMSSAPGFISSPSCRPSACLAAISWRPHLLHLNCQLMSVQRDIRLGHSRELVGLANSKANSSKWQWLRRWISTAWGDCMMAQWALSDRRHCRQRLQLPIRYMNIFI